MLRSFLQLNKIGDDIILKQIFNKIVHMQFLKIVSIVASQINNILFPFVNMPSLRLNDLALFFEFGLRPPEIMINGVEPLNQIRR